MNKIIPVLSLIISVVCLALSACGAVTISIAVKVEQVAVIAVPIILVSGVLSGISTAVNAFFTKSKLCVAALVIDACAFAASAVSIVIWLTVV